MRPAAPGLREYVSANLPRLSAVIPELNEPFYMVAHSRRVAEDTLFTDWGFPASRAMLNQLRFVDRPDRLFGLPGEGKILWLCYGYWEHPHRWEILDVAAHCGFSTLDSTEFISWLKKRMQNLAHLPASGGLPALEASLLRLQSKNPTKAVKPAGKAP